MNPVVVTFHGNTGDTGILQGLEGLDCTGKGTGEYLAGVEQVACYKDEINLLGNGIRHNTAKHTEKIFVSFGFTDRGAVCFAEVDVGGVDKSNNCLTSHHNVNYPSALISQAIIN